MNLRKALHENAPAIMLGAVMAILTGSLALSTMADRTETETESYAAVEAAAETEAVSIAEEADIVITLADLGETEESAELVENNTMIFSDDDMERLMRIAMAEAEGEDVYGKALVMLVVLNRTFDPAFPDTIEDVIFQAGQFDTACAGGRYYTETPDIGCYEALELVMNGWDDSQGAEYFESCSGESWHSRNLTLLFQHGNHRFYK